MCWSVWDTVTVFNILPVAPNISNIILCLKRAGHLPLNKALDLIGYLPLETHTVPLLQGLGYLENFYQIIEKRNELSLTKNLGVRRQKTRKMALDIVFMPALNAAEVNVRCCFSVCFGADVHPAIFPCCHWRADVDRHGLSVRATAAIRGPVIGLPPGRPSLSGPGTSEFQRLASIQRYTQVCLSILTHLDIS